MRSLIVILAIALTPALAACEKQAEKAQADIKKGNPEGGQVKKKYEAAAKESEERRREQTEK
jgi:hypothetical protein